MTTRTKKASANGKPRKRAKQQMIPGTEPLDIPEVSNAMESYVEARDARMAYGKQEVDFAGKLLDLMKSHNLQSYEHDNRIVTVRKLEKVKVKRMKEKDLADDGK
jgi:hypothetical protein